MGPARESKADTADTPALVRPERGADIDTVGHTAPPLDWPVQHVIALQRTAGNAAVAGVLAPQVQRQHAPPQATDERAKITRALQSGQYLDVAEITDLNQASEDEKVALSRICISGGYVAPQDATAKVVQLWSSMGNRLPSVAAANEKDWEAATRFAPRLMTLPQVTSAQEQFQTELRGIAEGNLQENAKFVEERKKALGLEGDDPLTPEQRTAMRRDIQSMAWHIWELRQEQEKQKTLIVGYASQNLGFGQGEVKFDPGHPPKYPRTLFSTPPAKWEDAKSAWDDAEKEITRIGNDYPELYEASMGDASAALQLSRVVPEHFSEQTKQQLLQLAARIEEVRGFIRDGKLNLLGLPLLHQQLYSGKVTTSGRDWTKGFDRWAAGRVVDANKQQEETVKALLKTVEVMAMVAGAFTGGLGMLVAAGVTVGIEAFQAGQAAVEAGRMEKAAAATPLTGTALLTKIQADQKRSEAIAHMVQAVTAALLAGGPALVKGLRAIRLKALVEDEVLLARLKSLTNGDEVLLERLLRDSGVPAKQLEPLLARVGNGGLTETLLARCPDGARLGRLLDRVPDPKQLEELLAGVAPNDLAKLEEVLAKLGEPGKGTLSFNVGGELETKAGAVIINPGRQAMPVDKLRSLKPDNLVVEAGAERIPFPDGSGKLIVGNKLPNSIGWETAVPEFKRVLMPGGRVEITVFGPGAPLRTALQRNGFKIEKTVVENQVFAVRP